MRAIKAQYFLAFAVMGSLLPYLSVVLKRRGLTDPQVADVQFTTGLAIFLTPAVLGLLADTKVENRTILGTMFLVGSIGLGGMLSAEGFWPLMLTHAVYALAIFPLMPMQDGLLFRYQQQTGHTGSYHRVRVYGTVGFIVPSLVLYVALAWGAPLASALVVAIGCCGLGALNSLRLPAVRDGAGRPLEAGREVPEPEEDEDEQATAGSKLPTVQALRTMLQPRVLVFCIGMWLFQLIAACYYSYYPLYLTDLLGVEEKWIGLIANIGVVLEIFFMLSFGWLVARIGLRGVMVLGSLATMVRLGLLFAFPMVVIGIATQLFHGLQVLVLHVGPPVFLNAKAGPSFRSSMQGLYAMLVLGSGRMLGFIFAGRVSNISLTAVFAYGASLALVATLLFAVAVHRSEKAGAS
ncbi:MAG: MFS transporter [Phycisphaeraceae bacterium]